jgi:hypothetical protein
MTVQTIPNIDEMTPDWHREYLLHREKAVANGEDSFVTLDEFEADLRAEL